MKTITFLLFPLIPPDVIRAFVSKHPLYNPTQMRKVRNEFLDTKEAIAEQKTIMHNQRTIQDSANTIMDHTSTSEFMIKIPVKTKAEPAHPTAEVQKGYKKKQETRFQTTAEIKQPNLKQR